MLADQEPDGESGVEPARNEQDRSIADEAERRCFAGRNSDAVRLDAAQPCQMSYTGVVAPASRPANGDDRIGFVARQRFVKLRQLSMDGGARSADKSGNHDEAGIDQRCFFCAAVGNPDMRFAHVQFRKANRGSCSTIESPQPFTGAPQYRLRREISACWQNALSGRDRHGYLDAIAALGNGVERCQGIRSSRQRLAGWTHRGKDVRSTGA